MQLGFTFLPCVLSGLSNAPQYLSKNFDSLGKDCLLANDVDSVIVPINACGGDGTLAFARSKQYKVIKFVNLIHCKCAVGSGRSGADTCFVEAISNQ